MTAAGSSAAWQQAMTAQSDEDGSAGAGGCSEWQDTETFAARSMAKQWAAGDHPAARRATSAANRVIIDDRVADAGKNRKCCLAAL